jgi:hypothetical protein
VDELNRGVERRRTEACRHVLRWVGRSPGRGRFVDTRVSGPRGLGFESFEWVRPDVELVRDVSVSDWIVSTLEPWSREGVRLNSFMPAGFQTHARVFHPFREWDGVSVTWRRWRDRRRTRVRHRSRDNRRRGCWRELARRWPLPEERQLPDPTCRSLVGILTVETRTPQTGWFAIRTPLRNDKPVLGVTRRHRARSDTGRCHFRGLGVLPHLRRSAVATGGRIRQNRIRDRLDSIATAAGRSP